MPGYSTARLHRQLWEGNESQSRTINELQREIEKFVSTLRNPGAAMNEQAGQIFATQLEELRDVLGRVPVGEFNTAAELIADAPGIHLTGRGRNELALMAFGNRLRQLGKPVSILGNILAGPVGKGDLVLIASGSGTTSALIEVANASRALNANVLVVSRRADSPLAQTASARLTIPALSTGESVQPLGTLFEQCLGIVCDALIIHLMPRLSITTDAMQARHANIE